MTTRIHIFLSTIFLSTALALVLGTATAYAGPGCTQSTTNISQADTDWWNTHACQQPYCQWQYLAYDIHGADWTGHGYDHDCTLRFEYTKFWGASFLVNYGLSDDYNHCFHFSQSDYRPLAEAASSNFHDHDVFLVPGGISGYGSNDGSGNITLGCLLFDSTLSGANANPASRAGDFMHESWHSYFGKYGWSNGSCNGHRCKNDPGNNGGCTLDGCDYFYFHKISAYGPGALWENDGTANRFHSPNQVQVEFLCDVNQYPAANVPASVRTAAKSDADTRAVQRFLNGPGYKCGDPRPW